MKIKLIIFDLDGTLVNSIVDITNALNYAIGPYGTEQLTIEKTTSLVGEGVTRLIEKLVGQKASDLKAQWILRLKGSWSTTANTSLTLQSHIRVSVKRLRCSGITKKR